MAANQNSEGLLVQITSYNTNLQGVLGLPQDLVDWLSPTLQVSNFLSGKKRAPDIVAVGFQELLPLHLGLAGLSKAVLDNRNALILSQIEAHAPNKESYSLVAKIANVGIALLVYARDDGIARRIGDVQTQWTGTGPGYMGNKGAVGVRFTVSGVDGAAVPEVYTFVNCHLTPHDHKLQHRLNDYKHIVSTLLFKPISPSSHVPSTLYDTSHLFVFGDMNFRLDTPVSTSIVSPKKDFAAFEESLDKPTFREEVKEYDQLLVEKRKGNVFVGLREGEFWKFKCSYKYKIGETDRYSSRRTPAWTDRILYATFTDSASEPDKSAIQNLLYTSIPSYTTSDHKPVVSLLLLPPTPPPSSTIPTIPLPASYKPTPDPRANLKKYTGRVLDRAVGIIWWLLTFLGAGSGFVGFVNFFVGLGAFTWWRGRAGNGSNNV
ncbi:skeletal muscle/kidney enriched inositol 5-phosphatase [Coprinopsis cinerea okayama7|uniref:Skeletal muscle/kidney enriched inositol 5-phosphatase n=1 Tax=Coprinopsis cinerea (strain Okayama-7 / 130 / ATCC MYA-4618 / FGSC 9003) TaxID=240176 RepID=A8NEK6_COPC7|nr:skeletal muscle/kidney enriched inositol 5-phosphatase [Coprinopsis cinerea okayama7\|eukprot:XP_001833058.2 skeletal muscle/kidney enriched inositol 5-phosphatase [Coprinopsis cinerea okayama7\